ncbi:TlpA family protein disulfide reductase [Janibacter anophelis]|uniref:TlpA family protein disulfide reductase n=1 Tax=Janibacter anophelis TaxID=319054 RepID=UPI000832B153|nr:TlpA disulfide reductase family protein [Janibacter anophelis]
MKTVRPTRRTLLASASALVLAGTLAACGESAAEKAAKEVGSRNGDGSMTLFEPAERGAPVELAGETIQGKTWDSADERGKVVVVNLWASWCGPCAKEAPHLVEAHEETKGPDVAFVGINYRESSKETGRAQGEEWGFVWPSVYDKSGQSAIDMQGKMTTQPSTAVLDREGRIAAVVLGPVTTSTLVGVVEDTLAESA